MIGHHMKMLGSNLLLILVICALLFLNLHKPLKTMKVTKESGNTALFFSSVTNPLNTTSVLSPQDGIVTDIYKQYGSYVKKDDLLFNIKSTVMESEFRQNVENYLKSKAAYQKTLFNYQGNMELYKAGLISKQAFMDQETQLKDSEYAALEAELQLKKTLLSMGVHFKKIEKLSLDDIEQVKQLFRDSMRGSQIVATADGLLLFSSTTLGTASEKSGPLKVGSQTRTGEAMAVIADMTGLMLQITVPQTDFHDVHVNDDAIITSPAFEGITLKGKVASIDKQAQGADFNSVPAYLAYVKVPKISQEARDKIQVGMTAQVELTKELPPAIKVPISAVISRDNVFFVKKLDPNTRRISEVEVTPGTTDETSVQILKGLSEGDEIVLAD